MQTPHLWRARSVTVPVILQLFHKLGYVQTVNCFYAFSSTSQKTQSVTAGIFIPSLDSSISVRASQRTLHHKDQWCARVYVFTHSTVIFRTVSTKFWMHLKFCENPSGGSRILPVHGQTAGRPDGQDEVKSLCPKDTVPSVAWILPPKHVQLIIGSPGYGRRNASIHTANSHYVPAS